MVPVVNFFFCVFVAIACVGMGVGDDLKHHTGIWPGLVWACPWAFLAGLWVKEMLQDDK